TSIFPEDMLKVAGKIRNFAGFSIDNTVVLGMNYNHQVSSYDISVVKAIAIYFDLINTIKDKVMEIEKSFEYTTNALARAAEANDDSTGSHIKRVNTFSKMLAEEMGLDREFIKTIFNAAQMHDVGKIYVDKSILTKPGRLTLEEFENMKKHTLYGELIIGDSENLKMSAEIARCHHEKFDGSGYPDGRRGEDIPLSARIVALADVYDALRSKRPYKAGFSHEEAHEIITKGDGRVMPVHFDPLVLEAFKNIHLRLAEIYNSFWE
ncbi:MAG: HD domain-containing protein, partial [Bacillota bacterium]|nr:HD domain-containing protein [Bacillota bacterium]